MKSRAIPFLISLLSAFSLSSCGPASLLDSSSGYSEEESSFSSSKSTHSSKDSISSFESFSSTSESISGSKERPSVSRPSKPSSTVNEDPTLEYFEFHLSEDGKSYCVTKSRDFITGKFLIIPETYEGLPVTAVEDEAFKLVSDVQLVYLPDTIERIGDSAFERCHRSNLMLPNIPANLEYVGENAFYRTGLKSFYIPEHLSHIGSKAFGDCAFLTEFIVDPFNFSFSEYDGVLMNIDETEIVAYPSGKNDPFSFPTTITSIGDGAFCGSQVAQVVLPESVTHVGKDAFSFCSYLESIVFPNGVTEIAEGVFESSFKLYNFEYPSGITSIGARAFKDTGVISVNLPSGVTSIGDEAFSECALYSLSLNEGLKTIGRRAFKYTRNLSSVTFPSTLETIGDEAFSRCAFTSAILNEGLSTLGERVFEGCRYLTTIRIPSSVTKIGEAPFLDAARVHVVTVASANPNYSASDDVLYDKNKTVLICCPLLKSEITIPDTVKKIATGAFYETGITEITIPDSVTEIGKSAFEGSNYLETIHFGKHVTSIGAAAFMHCEFLEDFDFPYELQTIERDAFFGCVSLKNVSIPNTVTSIGYYAFYECKNLETLKLGIGVVLMVLSTIKRSCYTLGEQFLTDGINSLFQ